MTLKAGLDQTIEVNKICSETNFGMEERTNILIIVTKLQTEIVFLLENSLFICSFYYCGDEPILGSQFEQIIDNLATTINNNYDNLANTIRDKNPQEITKSLNTYSEFIMEISY
ncbi:hypothetical protein [Acinetobacter bereziniae]|uniref:hypothetical protein n=1 Tax=Acinetobacter bereziniae TaxID=106648 RepID=UPI00208EAD5C|nr:hypothetical protein [Acinetobacter bereziniae]